MALLALLIWPVVAPPVVMRHGPALAVIVLTVAGYLLLPERVSLPIPALPDYDKRVAIALGAGLGALLSSKRDRRRRAAPARREGDRLLGALLVLCGLCLVAGPVLTWQANQGALVYGPTRLPGLGLYDAGSMVLGNLVLILPFLLGYRYLRDPGDHRRLLTAIFVAGVAYAALAAFEVRMSPQLNIWIYGYFPHSWVQHVRGGFRPVVFLQHGLWLGFFLFVALMAGLARAREGGARTGALWLGVLWVALVLAISKNLGALMLAILFGAVVIAAGPRMQVRVAAAVTALFLAYPVVWQAGLVPTDWFTRQVASISQERAQSFAFRLYHEEQLVAHAAEKPLTGWGSWGRNRVYDPETGRDVSVTDGLWILQLGARGWIGYLGFFGLVCFPVLAAARGRTLREVDRPTAALCLITAANCIYLVPNSALSPIGWLIAGAVAGAVRHGRTDSPDATPGAEPARRGRQRRYTRFGPGGAPGLVDRPA